MSFMQLELSIAFFFFGVNLCRIHFWVIELEILFWQVYSNRILRFLEEPSDSLSLIRDADRLVAYRLPNDLEESPLVVFIHQCMDE